MARTVASLRAGSRITDYISLGVVAKFFPREKVAAVLEETGRASVRERDLPAHVVVYYVIALALYMRSSYREVLRCFLEGVQWLLDPSAAVKVAGRKRAVVARSANALVESGTRWSTESRGRAPQTRLNPQVFPGTRYPAPVGEPFPE